MNYTKPSLPFGDVKPSGLNRYHGKIGLRRFTDDKVIVIDDGTEPSLFPSTEPKPEQATKPFAGV